MKFGPLSTAILISAAFGILPATAGQLYKWTDANGRVQYSDTKPTGAKAVPVRSASPPPTPAPAATSESGSASMSEKEEAFRKRRAEAQEKEQKVAKESSEKNANDENCRRAKSSLSSLDQGGRYYETDSDGNRKYYDQSRIDSEKERVRKYLAENCA